MSGGAGDQGWTEARAERQLRSLELFGMRFGLDRMRRMMTALGSPQGQFASVHVLGTNGKTSTTRMIAAIIERHGLRTGAYLSPHLVSYSERVRIGERELTGEEFAAAVARATHAAEQVNRTLAEDDHVTQFELLTAAAFWELADVGVDVAVVEAGLGGRFDATSVIDSPVTVLTGVGLEHTRWLGPTVHDIAEEKLAVIQEHGTVVLGEGLHADALAVAERIASERDAEVVRASSDGVPVPARAQGAFQRRNFGLALAAARVFLDRAGIALEEAAVADAAASVTVPGRLQRVADDPPTILDGAHNPDAVLALAQSLPELQMSGPLALVVGVLDDKDVAAMLATLLPLSRRAWFTAPASGRALSPAALESHSRQLGFADAESEPRPVRALKRAQEWARAEQGWVLATGSVYLVGELIGALRAAAPGEAALGSRVGETG
ncbi:MAG TPA: cyanophycin synthetase [Solirubrobacteraceae bacterium]|jgi:dihydrofolate synthase/folylpolyglutamate synthase|nr:cyanophycin synthetase [Solirubrobacteraceae bacterium]